MLKTSTARKPNTARLSLEALEDRQLLSATPVLMTVASGQHGTAFGLDAQGHLYQNVNAGGWSYLNAVASSFSVGTDRAGRDEVYFLGKGDHRLYRCDQGVSTWTGGGLKAGFKAGQGEVFGFDGRNILYIYSETTGRFTQTSHTGKYLSVGTDLHGNDEVFELGLDNIIYRGDQGVWASTGGGLNIGFQGGRGEVFGFDTHNTFYVFSDQTGGWSVTSSIHSGKYLSVGTDLSWNDEVFILGLDNIITCYDQGVWTSTGGGLNPGFGGGHGEVFGYDGNHELWSYHDHGGWTDWHKHGTSVGVGTDSNGNETIVNGGTGSGANDVTVLPPAGTGSTQTIRDTVGNTFVFDGAGNLVTINNNDVHGGSVSGPDEFGYTTVSNAQGTAITAIKLTGNANVLVDPRGARLGTSGQAGNTVSIVTLDGTVLNLFGF